MKLMTIPAAAIAATFVFAQSAQARDYHRHRGLHREASQHWSRSIHQDSQPQEFAGGFWNNSEEETYPRGRHLPSQQFAGSSWNGEEEAAYTRGRRRPPAQQFAGGSWNGAEEAVYTRGRRRRPAQQFAGGSWNGAEATTYQTAPAYQGGLGGRPSAWCGWEMRQLVSGDPGPEYNLARNWAHWGHSGPVGVGAVVVWAHHVGKIVGQQNGNWVIESGNDGHALRTRPLSIAGAIAIRWG
jgi:hypothetical protein